MGTHATGGGRLRWGLYAAFAALTLGVLLQVGWSLRLEQWRAEQVQRVHDAGLRPDRVQQLGRQAALLVLQPERRAAHARELDHLLAVCDQEAARLDALLARQRERRPLDAGFVQALGGWRLARQQLLDAAAALQAVARWGDASPTSPALIAAAAEVQARIDPALGAAELLIGKLQAAASQGASDLRRQVLAAGGALLVLLVLAATQVEFRLRTLVRRQRQGSEPSAALRRIALVAERTAALVVMTDLQDRIVWVNEAFSRVCGWPLAEAQGRTLHDLMDHPFGDRRVSAKLEQALKQGEGLRFESLRRTRDGRDLWLDVDLQPLYDAAGRLEGYLRVGSDVTARVQQQGKLQALWTALPAGVVVHDAEGAVVDGNLAAQRMLGRTLAELQGLTPLSTAWDVIADDGSPCTPEQWPSAQTLRTGMPMTNQSLGVARPGGERRWLLVNTEPQFDAQSQVCGVITCFTDITESRELQARLRAHARTDALTQLPNRAVVMEHLQRAVSHALRHPGYGFALLFMDFDRFKQVNDTLGHGAGDELLRQIAERLTQVLRPGDVVLRLEDAVHLDAGQHVAARIGGDEFVVVLDGVSDDTAVATIANRLLDALAEPYRLGSTPVHSSASIGVVRYDAPADAAAAAAQAHPEAVAEALLRDADTAMYEAKRAGRGRWVLFDDSMHERVVRVTAVENDLRRALQNDELFVVYQPVVDLGNRAPVGVEALVRWRHPERGLVPPGDFIGIAEECGLIDAVGDVVLRKACAQFVQWQQTLGVAAPRQLAVNLSRAQLKRATLVAEVQAVLQATGMPAQQLQLEVTESLAAQDEGVQVTLRDIKALGVKLALDDFGTGYSSLACLNLLPVDTVKIDRSFVRHAETGEYQRVLIEATIRVARTLEMVTVAEGIETEAEAALMRRLACDRGQGFLFARPLLPEDLAAWMQHHAPRVAATEVGG